MVDVSYTETPQSCSNICQSFQGCLWFTHDSATKGCYSLKHCIPVLDCPTCVSGEVNCPYEEGIHQNPFPWLSRFLPFSMFFPVCVACFPSSLEQGQCLEKVTNSQHLISKLYKLFSTQWSCSQKLGKQITHTLKGFFRANLENYNNEISIFIFFQALCDW